MRPIGYRLNVEVSGIEKFKEACQGLDFLSKVKQRKHLTAIRRISKLFKEIIT